MKSSSMTIGAAAGRFGLPTHVLRHWEAVGLLAPARTRGGGRRYDRHDLVRVASIVALKRAGLPLPDIGEFLASIHTPARKDVLRRNRSALRARMAALEAALGLVEAGLNCAHDDIATCPSYHAQLAELLDAPAPAAARAAAPPRRPDPSATAGPDAAPGGGVSPP